MKQDVVKILWGRSGNRCAFPGCRKELTPSGARSVLGEMAHIVAKSSNGPRGDSDLTSEERDEYDNLILLCPTDHTQIDGDSEEWTVEKLKRIKLEHESWVASQLEEKRIVVKPVDNSAFLESRQNEWLSFGNTRTCIICSLTPLIIAKESINPLDNSFIKLINNISLSDLPDSYSCGLARLSPSHTRPNEYGLINENIINGGRGYKVQIFRNGHCEFLLCVEDAIQVYTSNARKGRLYPGQSARIFIYQDLAKCIIKQIRTLLEIWKTQFSFNDMLMSTLITNTNSLVLDSGRKSFTGDYVYGFPIQSKYLDYSKVVNKDESSDELVEVYIQRFVNYSGLMLDSLFEKGNLQLPRRL